MPKYDLSDADLHALADFILALDHPSKLVTRAQALGEERK